MMPNDKPLGKPVRAFSETFSAETVVADKFFARSDKRVVTDEPVFDIKKVLTPDEVEQVRKANVVIEKHALNIAENLKLVWPNADYSPEMVARCMVSMPYFKEGKRDE